MRSSYTIARGVVGDGLLVVDVVCVVGEEERDSGAVVVVVVVVVISVVESVLGDGEGDGVVVGGGVVVEDGVGVAEVVVGCGVELLGEEEGTVEEVASKEEAVEGVNVVATSEEDIVDCKNVLVGTVGRDDGTSVVETAVLSGIEDNAALDNLSQA